MTTVYFVRHAQSDFTWTEDETRPLTHEALTDLRQLESFFVPKAIDRVYSSPYRRAVETIRTVARDKGREITLDQRFKERVCGVDGQLPGNLEHRWRDFTFCELEGESLLSLQRRNIEALNEILDKHPHQAILVGTHGTALSTIINHYNPQFGLSDFLRIIDLMPLVVRLEFNGKEVPSISEMFSIKKEYSGKNHLKVMLEKTND